MTGGSWRRLKGVAAVVLLSIVTLSRSADIDVEKVRKDIVGSWIVDVVGEQRTRTLNIKTAEMSRDGVWILDTTYGWTDGGQSEVITQLTVKPDGYRLVVTTQANSVVAAESSGPSFTGTFTWTSGKVAAARLDRFSNEEIARRAANLTASSFKAAIKQPAADVPASCAGFVGGWTGRWPYYGQTWLWVTEVDANCVAKYAHNTTAAFPGRLRTVQVKDGVLVNKASGWTQSFELKKGELWANHYETGQNNHAVFRRIEPRAD